VVVVVVIRRGRCAARQRGCRRGACAGGRGVSLGTSHRRCRRRW
jgi:hypothetical protein